MTFLWWLLSLLMVIGVIAGHYDEKWWVLTVGLSIPIGLVLTVSQFLRPMSGEDGV